MAVRSVSSVVRSMHMARSVPRVLSVASSVSSSSACVPLKTAGVVRGFASSAYEELVPKTQEERVKMKKKIGFLPKEKPSPWDLDVIPAKLRTTSGSNISKKIRSDNFIPSIVHGITRKRLLISVDHTVISHMAKKKSNFMNSVVELDIENYPNRVYALPKEVQRDPGMCCLFEY